MWEICILLSKTWKGAQLALEDFSPLVGENQTPWHQSSWRGPGCARKIPWSTDAEIVSDALNSLSGLNRSRSDLEASVFLFNLSFPLQFHMAPNILVCHTHFTHTHTSSTCLFFFLPALLLVNSGSTCLIRSTARRAGLSSSVRGRKWRWLYWWSDR